MIPEPKPTDDELFVIFMYSNSSHFDKCVKRLMKSLATNMTEICHS